MHPPRHVSAGTSHGDFGPTAYARAIGGGALGSLIAVRDGQKLFLVSSFALKCIVFFSQGDSAKELPGKHRGPPSCKRTLIRRYRPMLVRSIFGMDLRPEPLKAQCLMRAAVQRKRVAT